MMGNEEQMLFFTPGRQTSSSGSSTTLGTQLQSRQGESARPSYMCLSLSLPSLALILFVFCFDMLLISFLLIFTCLSHFCLLRRIATYFDYHFTSTALDNFALLHYSDASYSPAYSTAAVDAPQNPNKQTNKQLSSRHDL